MHNHPADQQPEWVEGHAHEPNLQTPRGSAEITVYTAAGHKHLFTPDDLAALPLLHLPNCMIVSTGHGASGPFTFGGARLSDLLAQVLPAEADWLFMDLAGADGFGTRLRPTDLAEVGARPILLAYLLNGIPLTRQQGLVRLIAPAETDDALRQIKWLQTIRVHS